MSPGKGIAWRSRGTTQILSLKLEDKALCSFCVSNLFNRIHTWWLLVLETDIRILKYLDKGPDPFLCEAVVIRGEIHVALIIRNETVYALGTIRWGYNKPSNFRKNIHKENFPPISKQKINFCPKSQ